MTMVLAPEKKAPVKKSDQDPDPANSEQPPRVCDPPLRRRVLATRTPRIRVTGSVHPGSPRRSPRRPERYPQGESPCPR
ncbi:MAG: hypothetical protein R2705_03375 [Ilumatobacteraceae bacterium]